jgi:hypothetical protein
VVVSTTKKEDDKRQRLSAISQLTLSFGWESKWSCEVGKIFMLFLSSFIKDDCTSSNLIKLIQT